MHPAEAARKFHFIREIASGGFGSVFLAKVIHADGFSRFAAIKLLHPKWSENEEIASRMRDEARLLGQLRHRNIVEVIDLTMVDGRVAVIMEFLEAVDLRTVIEHCRAVRLHMPLRVALEIAACVSSALDAAYNRPPMAGEKALRVIHRDIKPSNVMIDDSGTPKVLDFGVARADFAERESHTQEIAFGSVDYMPPERMFFEPESASSDVYSLGCTLFELLMLDKLGKGKLRPEQHAAFLDERLTDLLRERPDLRPDEQEQVRALLRDMLAFDDADRPSASALTEQMRAFARGIRDEESLNEWAERIVPPLYQDGQKKRAQDRQNPLVDKILDEDSRGFRQGRAQDAQRRGADDDVGLDQAPPEDDARWNALKRATLAEIESETQMTPRPVPRASPPSAVIAAIPPPPPRVRAISAKPGELVDLGSVPPARARSTPPGRQRVQAPPPRAPTPPPRTPVSPPRDLDPDDETEETDEVMEIIEEESGPSFGVLGIAAVVAGAMLVFVVVALGAMALAIGVARYGVPGSERTAAVPVPVPVPAPVAAIAPADDAVAIAPHAAAPPVEAGGAELRVVSGLPGTKKLTVRCDGAEAEGEGEATVRGGAFTDCTVTGIDAGRKRLVAVVKQAGPGTLVCFEDGAKECRR